MSCAHRIVCDSARSASGGAFCRSTGCSLSFHERRDAHFDQRVLSTQGSQFMYTIDYGAGFNIFHHGNQAVTVGYRYQHLSNANISIHNPGTDANTFYVGISRFHNVHK